MSKKDLHQEMVDLESKVHEKKTKQNATDLERFDQSGYTKDRDLVNRLLGRVQATNAFSKMANVVTLSELAKVKENKLYKALKGSIIELENGEKCNVGTFEGFCKSIGMSKSKVHEDLKNLQLFGEEALTAMNAAGLGYRDMRKLRQLPNDDRTLIINKIEANLDDKEAVKEELKILVNNHDKEKEALNNEITDLKQKDETNERLFADKDKKINELDRKLDKAKCVPENWSDRVDEINRDSNIISFNALQAINQMDDVRETILAEAFKDEHKKEAIEAMARAYLDLSQQVLEKALWLVQHADDHFGKYKLMPVPTIGLESLSDSAVIGEG